MLHLVRLVQLAAMLAVVGAASGQQCEVSLARSPCGKATRVSSGSNFAFILNDGQQPWASYALNGEEASAAFANGSSQVGQLAELAEEERAQLEQRRSSQLNGTNWTFDGQRLAVDSTSGARFCLSSNENRTFQLKEHKAGEFALLNLDESSRDVQSLLVQNRSIVTIVARNCSIHSLPMAALPREQQQQLARAMEGPFGPHGPHDPHGPHGPRGPRGPGGPGGPPGGPRGPRGPRRPRGPFRRPQPQQQEQFQFQAEPQQEQQSQQAQLMPYGGK